MSTPYRRDLERLRFRQGQTLTSRDYRDQGRFDARRRQWHNRALHGVYGVAFGLELKQHVGDAQSYDVACGLAYDCRGRELVLQRTRTVQLPAAPSWLMFRLRQATVAASTCCVSPDPGCTPDPALLLEDDFELAWSPVGSYEPIDGVALAKSGAAGLDAGFRRREARPLARPRLARGQTVRGNTSWEPWAIDEPDGNGGLRKRVVGVQTHIDTSAAGFTDVPCYFAAIDSPEWNITTAEFAPAFFPHVADPAVDGFTFRLLMVETARRRYTPAFGVARVQTTSRDGDESLQIDVDNATPFKTGDPIALLRPRADEVVRVGQASSGTTVKLAAALAGTEPGKSVLAIGNLPRTAQVINVSTDVTILAAFAAKPAVKAHDVLIRVADSALAVIDAIDKNMMTVSQPFPEWKANDPVQVARMSKAVTVSTATRATDGLSMSLQLTPATHKIEAGQTIVLVDKKKALFAKASKVTSRNAAAIVVQPALDPVEIAGLKQVVAFTADIDIKSVEPKSPDLIVTMSSVGPFAVGDFVAAANASTAIATIKKIDAAKQTVSLSPAIAVKPQDDLVAANWRCATTVNSAGGFVPNQITVGRADAVVPGSFVVRREGNGFSKAVPVAQVSGASVLLSASIPGLARLDTLAVGVFARVATVLSQQPGEVDMTIAEAHALSVGDQVMLAGAPGPAPVAQVVSVSASGTTVGLNVSLGALTAGQKLAIVHFRDTVGLTDVDAVDPTQIEVDRDVELREGDVVGLLAHYADNSSTGFVETVQGNRLTLAGSGIAGGDGIVSQDWIDGGIVGAAAVTYSVTPFEFQPLLRLVSTDGLEQPRPSVASGFDLMTGAVVSRPVLPLLLNAATGHVAVYPLEQNGVYRLRPETLSIITTFNADFPRAFATFAQKQNLSVRWFGCLREFPRPAGCPGGQPYDVCPEPISSGG